MVDPHIRGILGVEQHEVFYSGTGCSHCDGLGVHKRQAVYELMLMTPRLQALITYAPRVWLHPDEEYFPSSVEFAFPFMTRFLAGDSNYWIRSTAALDSPSDTLPFFAGDLDGAPVYAFYADKGSQIVDLVYFFYYPYNRGKSVVDTIWGNHVGDWEHITVRLMRGPDDALTPLQVYFSAHDFGGAYDWASVERFADTHPVVYSAWGSHGVWSTPGAHEIGRAHV